MSALRNIRGRFTLACVGTQRVGRVCICLVVVQGLLGCHSDADPGQQPTAPSPPQPPSRLQAPPPGTVALNAGAHTLVGQVFDAYSGVVANANVVLAIDDSSGAGWFVEVSSDQNGQFTVSGFPDSNVMLHVWKTGFVQPCAVLPVVTRSLALQVEVTSLSTLENLYPPRPQSAGGISLTGVVFEIANGAKQPIAGAELWAEAESWAEEYDDKPVATTRSDLRGGYFLCNLPRGISVFVSKPGFTTAVVSRIDASQSLTLDIELERR